MNGIAAIVVRRAGTAIASVLLAVTLAFFALRLLPGDGLSAQFRESGASAETIAERRAALGLDQPIGAQYGLYVFGLARGDLGVSLLDGRPVRAILSEQAGSTVALAASALTIGVLWGGIIGMAAASRRPTIARFADAIIAIGLSAPIFFTGTAAIALFATGLGWLPGSGESVILPACVLGFQVGAAIANVLAAELRTLAQADYIATARAKGLPERRIFFVHTLRAALTPVIAVIGLEAGYLLGGAVLTETLFARAGLGRVLINAALNQDYPVVQGVVVWGAVVVVIVNAIADALIYAVDSRVRAAS